MAQSVGARPYRLVRTYASEIYPGPTSVIAAYSSLVAAVAGARREYARVPDSATEIVCRGVVLRCLYHHGCPPDARWNCMSHSTEASIK